jgi:hypothetical protein
MPDARCEHVQALAPELALGIADGGDRAAALDHLASCLTCRRALNEQSELVDELLLLAPASEPPPGFETAVLRRLGGQRPARRLPRPLALLAAVVAAAALAAVGTFLALGDDRELAAQYRAALERVGGEYFEAAELRAADGDTAGRVFGYQGRPSWLLVLVYRDVRSGPLTAEVVSADGRRVPLRALDAEQGTWGGAIEMPLRDVVLVRLRRADGAVFAAELPRR